MKEITTMGTCGWEWGKGMDQEDHKKVYGGKVNVYILM